MENESLELDFLSALHTYPSKHRLHSKTQKHITHSVSLSCIPFHSLSVSFPLTLTLTLIPFCFVAGSHLLRLRHSLSLRHWTSFAPSCFVTIASSHSAAVAPSHSIAPSPPRSTFLPQTLILGGSAGSLSQE